eukprot:CAMPEP_0176437160 /NCGR_PEP_ID=MMETSP0127-20121128/18439_1 /TAXON_ID=938130 /ORGANISM="Platyophrya macrostoma, Strain WH" /LENGTH=211 /DNA_ID=CAMNT_0017820699 /DNA_START=27 /DNA_END=662 /DNA_ORIENTATION=-
MKAIFALALVSIAFFTIAAADDDAGDVIVLTHDNFKNVTEAGDSFVLFYAPWCGHCKTFKPTWKQFASQAKGKLTVGMVNCDDHSGICKAYGVRGYPTALLQKGDKVYKFRSARTLEQLQKFVDGEYQSAESQEVPTGDFSSMDTMSDQTMMILIIVGIIGTVVVLIIICVVCLDNDEPKAHPGEATGETGKVGGDAQGEEEKPIAEKKLD